MSITADYLTLSDRILALPDIPPLARLFFPADLQPTRTPDSDAEETNNKEDDFGFVILQDGSAGPFYTSFGDSLDYLRQHFSTTPRPQDSIKKLIQGFASPVIAHKALALGTFNAISQHLMRRSGYQPSSTDNSSGLGSLQAGERIGMVGYFCPLVDKLLAQGLRIQIIEKNPQRVKLQPGILLSTQAKDLAGCKQIICTASVLINNTLAELLHATDDAADFHLLGPSGSGLPDLVFARGVASMGGIFFPKFSVLQERLDAGLNWGDAGQKYQLTPANYPGIESLLRHA